jgi:hypothetical protein
MHDKSPGRGRVWCSRPGREKCTRQLRRTVGPPLARLPSLNLVLIGPDQIATLRYQWNHVVETAGTAAIAGDVTEGGHGVILYEVSHHMILPPSAFVNCSESGGGRSLIGAMRRADCFQGQSERRASYIVPVWSVRLFVLMLDRLGIRSGGEGRSRPRSMPRAARRLALGERRECFS